MQNARPYWKVIVSLTFNLLATIFVIIAGFEILRFLSPFVIGWLIACIANPVVCWLDKKLKIKRKLGSAIMITLVLGAVIGLVYLIVSMIIRELGELIQSLPQLYEMIVTQVNQITSDLSTLISRMPEWMKKAGKGLMMRVGDSISVLSEPTISKAGNVAMQIPNLIISTFVVILSAYFFVADRDDVCNWIKKVMPKSIYERGSLAIYHFKHAVGGYFIAQFKIMVVVCTILIVGLSLLKVEYVLVLSILISFLDFLPFFGTGVVFIPWCLYTVLTGNYVRALLLFVLYVTTQVVRQFIQPKLVGDEVGMKPLPTLLFIYIGYRLGGFLWMVLAVPLGIILIKMYEAGAFDYIFNDLKILVNGIKKLKE